MRYLYVIGDVFVTPGTTDSLVSLPVAALAGGLPFTVWDSQSGGAQVTDLTAPDGVTPLVAVADSNGQPPLFRGPDGFIGALYIDAGGSQRFPVFPIEGLVAAIAYAIAGGASGTTVPAWVQNATAIGQALAVATDAPAALGIVGGVSSADGRLSNTRTPTDGSVIDASVSPAAGISADKLADGVTKKVLTSAERGRVAAAFISSSGTGGTIYLRTLAQGVMDDTLGNDGDIQLVAVTG